MCYSRPATARTIATQTRRTVMRLALLLLALFVSSAPAIARQQISFVPILDTSIYQESGSVSNAKGTFLFAGRTAKNTGPARRALLAFDVSSIPTGATITGASLTLNMSKTIAPTTTVSLHRMGRTWGEGTSNAGAEEGLGATASAGDATWTQSAFGSTNWTTPGGDFVATASAQTQVAGLGKYTWTSAQMIQDVQAWVNGTATNAGWVVIGNEGSTATAKRFDSREHGSAASRPNLTVAYSIGTGVEDRPTAEAPTLSQNFPNPFRGSTRLEYSLSREAQGSLVVYDLLGRSVAQLASGLLGAGRHEVMLDADLLPPGIYIARLRVGDQVTTRQMVRMP